MVHAVDSSVRRVEMSGRVLIAMVVVLMVPVVGDELEISGAVDVGILVDIEVLVEVDLGLLEDAVAEVVVEVVVGYVLVCIN